MEGDLATMQRLMHATAAGSPIDREKHALAILRELRRVRAQPEPLDAGLLDRVRRLVSEQEACP
jgi:hypothetical protein